MWINKFKIAITQQNADAIGELLECIPEFTSIEEMKTAAFLCQEAITMMQDLQANQSRQKILLKKNIDFLQATHHGISAELNITS